MSRVIPHRTWIFLALLVLLILFFLLPALVEMNHNITRFPPPYSASERARKLHQDLLIADFHADSLLWNRDLIDRSSRGHVDIPRLIEGNVALQMFTVVTKVPWGLNIERNKDNSDLIFPLVMAERRPVSSWFSLTKRALDQAARLREFAMRSNGRFALIESRKDLIGYLERRRLQRGITAGILGIEGAHALEGEIANLDTLFDAGFRMIGLTHFFDNEVGGSAHGVQKGGLTPLGKELIRKMEAEHMLVDLAHASSDTMKDVLSQATQPVVVSHTGVKGTCNNMRNLSDDQIRGIAKTDGVVGIGYWETAVCGKDVKAIARAIRYTANLAGVEHVGLGSDFDGFVDAPFDVTGLVQLTDALLAEGFTPGEIRMIMGGNEIRVLLRTLP